MVKTYQIVILVMSLLVLVGFIVFYSINGEEMIPVTTQSEPGLASSGGDMPPINGDDGNVPPTTSSPSDDVPANEKTSLFNEDDIAAIDDVVKEYGAGVSVYYEELNSNNIYTFNTEEKYFIASLIKAPYCMYLYSLVEKGVCSLDEKFLIEKKDIKVGTGTIKDMEFEVDTTNTGAADGALASDEIKYLPLEFTMRELIALSLTESDNTATEIMRKRYNYQDYTEYALGLGISNTEDIKHITDGDIRANDAGVYIKAIYNFVETSPYGSELKKDMTHKRNTMISSKHDMIRKYGWAEKSFHDMAVVYAPRPYVLAILTNHDTGKKADYKLFADITRVLEKRQKTKYDD